MGDLMSSLNPVETAGVTATPQYEEKMGIFKQVAKASQACYLPHLSSSLLKVVKDKKKIFSLIINNAIYVCGKNINKNYIKCFILGSCGLEKYLVLKLV